MAIKRNETRIERRATMPTQWPQLLFKKQVMAKLKFLNNKYIVFCWEKEMKFKFSLVDCICATMFAKMESCSNVECRHIVFYWSIVIGVWQSTMACVCLASNLFSFHSNLYQHSRSTVFVCEWRRRCKVWCDKARRRAHSWCERCVSWPMAIGDVSTLLRCRLVAGESHLNF